MKIHAVLAALLLLTLPVDARAQNKTFAPAANGFGTQEESVLLIPDSEFMPIASNVTWSFNNDSTFITAVSGCCMRAPVQLPSGALLTGFEIEGCDSSSSGQIHALLEQCDKPAQSCGGPMPSVDTGVGEMPGCSTFRVNPFALGASIDNAHYTYRILYENTGDTTGAVRLRAARVYYKRQVSPPPDNPSFNDVPPTHPFYRYVEALKAAGITGGCSTDPPEYCPDAPITRGQMAVFLAVALGLQWAP